MPYEQSHALVVAVEQYAENVNDWSLNGPVADATRLINWLADGRVPTNNIHLFASAADGSESLKDLHDCVAQHGLSPWREANSNNIGAFLNEEMRHVGGGGLFFMYWSGHGLVDYTGGKRFLLMSDARSTAIRVLNLDDLIRLLNTSHMGPFAHHTLFIDACANYMTESQAPLQEPLLPAGGRAAPEMFVYLAAGQGEVAKTDPRERTGEFSQVLHDWLQQQGPANAWLAEREALIRHVDDHFKRLATTSQHQQKPVSRWGMAGGHELKPLGATPGSAYLPAAARHAHLSVWSIGHLARGLAALDLARDPEQWQAFELPEAITARLAEEHLPSQAYESLVAIAIELNQFETLLNSLGAHGDAADQVRVEGVRQDWITLRKQAALADSVRRAAQTDIVAAFHLAAPHLNDTDSRPVTAEDALRRLHLPGGEPGLLHDFLAQVELRLGAPVDNALWGISEADIARIREAATREANHPALPHLAVDLCQGTTPGQPWPDQVVAFLRDRHGHWTKYREQACTGDLPGVREAALQIIDECALELDASVGLLVRPEQLAHAPETWQAPNYLNGLALKQNGITLLHMADRAVPDHRMQKLWLKCLSDGPLQANVTWHDEQQAQNRAGLKKHLMDNRTTAIGLLGVPTYDMNPDRLGFLMAVSLGMPLLLWVDEAPPDWNTLRSATEQLLAGDLRQFPSRLYDVRAERPDAQAFLADHLRAIWDTPDHLPPGTPLPGMAE